MAAANAILDRGWGKPVQPLATDKAPRELLHRIERVIVHPDDPSLTTDEAGHPNELQLTSAAGKKLQ
ncbi:hypothetical protein IVB18_15295 [Bradyrhizobium sp. 186]|uniref:hypothetical protein n=1 Tax=Bradyrhizobium sp. 186 TaxID=2782654 RepID=UPI002044F5A6|nr:hypothetical protein IVB18_15295 [Bradyrhizobium sp. 186]